jgi:hypothetical protein
MVLSGAVVTVVGLAVAATSPVAPIASGASPDRIHAQQTAGGVLVVAGWALLGWGAHRFGRDA